MTSNLQREIKQTKPFQSSGHAAAVALLRTADVVRRHVGEVVAPHGVTLSQYNVLRILRGAEPGGLSINDVAERLIERHPGITRMLDRLERHGWVRRERQADDRRMILCHLTASGRKLVNHLDDPVQKADDEVVAGLSDGDALELLRLLDNVREHLSQI